MKQLSKQIKQSKPVLKESSQFVVFTLDEQRYALPLPVVDRVIRLVEVTALPKAPEIVIGIINVHGQIVPVVNVRRRFHLPEREPDLNDLMIIARTSKLTAALIVDAVLGVVESLRSQIIESKLILSGLEYIDGVIKLENGLILIHDLTKFLSLGEVKSLSAAISAHRPGRKAGS
jgi:purine-binding chemotaxis protein CheW